MARNAGDTTWPRSSFTICIATRQFDRLTHKVLQSDSGTMVTSMMIVEDRFMSAEDLPMTQRITKPAEALSHTEWIQEEFLQVLNAGAIKIEDKYGREYDALTGQMLDPHLINEGRLLEMQFLQKWKVYTHASFDECKRRTRKPPIKTKWVQIN